MSAVDMRSPLSLLGRHRIIPVYTPDSEHDAVEVSRALLRGGIGVIEITLRTPVAMEAIRAVAAEVPGMAVGAGTVLDISQMHQAQQAGAVFAVSPGAPAELLDAAKGTHLVYLPGVATSTEIMAGLAAGYTLFKVFPAEPINALALLSAWQGPFPRARFCPTGGITATRARAYLQRPNVACLGGSWLTPSDAIARGDWEAIESLARAAVRLSGAV